MDVFRSLWRYRNPLNIERLEDRTPVSTTLDILLADLWFSSVAATTPPASSTANRGDHAVTTAWHSAPIDDLPVVNPPRVAQRVAVTRPTWPEPGLNPSADSPLGLTDLLSTGNPPFGGPFVRIGGSPGVTRPASVGPGTQNDWSVPLLPSGESPVPSTTPTLADTMEPSVSDYRVAMSSSLAMSSSNSPPVAVADSYTVVHDRQLYVDEEDGLLANDYDLDDDEPLQVLIVTPPAHGSLETQSMLPEGAFSYVPDTGYVGTDSFTYKLWDGLDESSVATVTIDVTNYAPDVISKSFTLTEGQTFTGDVLAGAYDPDGDPLQAVLVGITGNGALNLRDDGTFTYTPNVNFRGADSFTYKVTDGVATTSTLTSNLTVNSAGPFDLDGRDAATDTAWMREPDELDYGLGVSTTSSAQIFLRVYDLPANWTVTERKVSWDPTKLAVNGVTSPGYIDLDPAGGNEEMSVTALATGYGETLVSYTAAGFINSGGGMGFESVQVTDAGVGVLGAKLGFAAIQELDAVERTAKLDQIKFTSDHDLIRENTKNVLKSGNRYDAVEFVRGKYNAPITHTWNSKIELDLTFSVVGINAQDQIAIVGTSTDQGLQFDSGVFAAAPVGNKITVHLVAKNKLAVDVYKIDAPITWRLFYEDPNTQQMVAGPIMGTSGSHRVYVTAGKPQNPINKPTLEVTDIRMERTVVVAKQAIADARARVAPNSPTFARIVYQIVRQHKFNGKVNKVKVEDGQQNGDPSGAWEVYDTWKVAAPNTGSDCISGAAFTVFVANMAGIAVPSNGTVTYRPLAAKSAAQPTVAVDFDPNDPNRSGLFQDPARQLWFRWDLWHRDRSGVPNLFEAAVVYAEPGGYMRYFPVGISEDEVTKQAVAYDTADKVLTVFDTLDWKLRGSQPAFFSKIHTYALAPYVGIDAP